MISFLLIEFSSQKNVSFSKLNYNEKDIFEKKHTRARIQETLKFEKKKEMREENVSCRYTNTFPISICF
jgi:hypothetical protein